MEQQPEVKNCTQGAAPGQNRKCWQQLTLFERIMSFHNIFFKKYVVKEKSKMRYECFL